MANVPRWIVVSTVDTFPAADPGRDFSDGRPVRPSNRPTTIYVMSDDPLAGDSTSGMSAPGMW